MAYTGTTSFAVTLNQICTRAAAKLNIIDTSLGESLDTNTLADFTFQLNVLIKAAMSKGAGNLWIRRIGTLFLQQGQGYDQLPYYLGPTTTDHWTYNPVTTVATSGASAPGATTIGIASVTGLVATNIIGIKLDSGVTFWTTISSVGTNSIVIGAGLPTQASSGNYTYSYSATLNADRPQRILEVYRRYTNGTLDVILIPMSRQVYSTLSNKQLQTIPTQWVTENLIPNTLFSIWPTSSGTSGIDQLILVTEGLIQDITNATDNPYFPIEWANFLIYELAYEMAPEYDIPQVKMQMLQQQATSELQALLDYSSTTNESPLQFGMAQDSGWSFEKGWSR